MGLLEKIKNLQSDICNQIDSINCGGCIHFAYYLSKQLTALKVEHTILFVNYSPIYLMYSKFNPVSHVAVYVPEIGYIDGEEIFTNIRHPYKAVRKVSLKKLDHFRNNFEWNSWYDTDQNFRLEHLIQKNLSI